MGPWHSSQVPLLTKSDKIGKQPLSSVEPSRSRNSHDDGAMRMSRQKNLKPSTESSVMVSSPITGLSYIELAQLDNHYQKLHVAPRVVELAL